MTSEAQLQANRKNAKQSTGPRTEEGKMASSRNATTHGCYATGGLAVPRGIFAEDPDEVEAFLARIVESLHPRDAVELEAATQVASACLRFRRLGPLEAEAMAGASPTEVGFCDRLSLRENDIDDAWREKAALRVLDEIMTITARVESRVSGSLDRAQARLRKLKERDLDQYD